MFKKRIVIVLLIIGLYLCSITRVDSTMIADEDDSYDWNSYGGEKRKGSILWS